MKNFKFSLIIMILISLCEFSFSQTTLYTQNFGTTGTTFPTGWSTTGGTTGWYITATTVSSGYTGASGGNNVRAGSIADTLNFSNVSTVGYSSITVIWGARRSATTSPSPVFQWSSDSITWIAVTFTDVPTTGTWALVNGGTRISLPSGASGVAHLRFRWIAAAAPTNASLRFDDFNVQGTQVSSLPPSKISIVSVNGGATPDTCHSFNIIVQTLDVNGIPSNVTSAATVTLTKLTGNGTGVLSGGSGTISSGQNTTTITVTYSRSEAGVSLLSSCGSLTTDTSSVFVVNPCIATLPSCFAWDVTGGITNPYPPGWTAYNLGTPNTIGHTAPNSGNFSVQGDSLVIHFNSASDSIVFYLATYNMYGAGYRLDVFESPNGMNYTTLNSFTTGLTAYPTWTGYTNLPLSTSRYIKFVYTTAAAYGTIAIDDICLKRTQISSLPPSKISIVSVNGGANPDTCHSFNVIVRTLDINGILANVTSTSNVTLTKLTGNGLGVLSGGNGTIPSGQNSCTISVTYSRSETGVSLLASCGSLTTDTSSVFVVNPCVTTLPSCYAWDVVSGNTVPYPAGWYNYGLGTPNAFGHTAANSGNFDTQSDSLLIHFNTASDSVVFYLATVNMGGAGAYQFDVFESPNGLNYTTLHSFTTGLTANPTWTGYTYLPLATSRFIKFVYTTQPPAGPGGASDIAIDDICIKMASSTPATSATATPSVICSGSSSTLSLTGGLLSPGSNWYWYTGSCGGTYVKSGATPTVSPTVTTMYYVRAEGTTNTTSCVSVGVHVNNERPSYATASPSSICSGTSETLSTVSGFLVAGADWFWYTGQCGGTLVGSGTSIILNPSVQTTYFVRGSGVCNTTACATVTVMTGAINPPSPVSATPAAVCPGSSTSLHATSAGNTIAWWDASTGGNMLGTSGSGLDFPVSPTITTTYYAEAGLYLYNSQTFTFSSSQQVFTVPNGLTMVGIDAYGAQGGFYDTTYGNGGLGGRVLTNLSVTSGQALYIYVGGQGTYNSAGWNGGGCGTGCLDTTYFGGGGGGATDIRIGGTNLTNRVIVAGGGGGAAYYTTNLNSDGGVGGGLIGGNGLRVGVYNATYCGSGGSQTAGGLAATYVTGASAGTLGIGGASIAGGANGGGGGGGGYYGGGPGISSGAGGGGSSYVTTTGTSNTIHTQGYQLGDGQLIISWYTSACVSTRASVTVTINTTSTVPTSLSASSNNICTGNSVTLSETGGTLGGGASWEWFSGSCSGTYLISGASVAQSPTVTSIYWVKAIGTCNTTTCLSITISVTSNTIPTSVSASPSNVCQGISSTLSEIGGTLVSGSNWYWYTGSCGGTYLVSGASTSVNPTVATTYWVRGGGSCNTTACLSVTVSIGTPSSPTNVTATPASLCPGTSTSLNATSTGNTITWWDAATNGNMFGTSASGVNFTLSPTITTSYYAEAGVYVINAQTFTYTGSQQIFTVPAGLTQVGIDAYGAQGGFYDSIYGYGGLGGRVQTRLTVTPSQILYIYVGSQGDSISAGWNGGGCGTGCLATAGYFGSGGGGATDIRISGTNLTNRIIVAGGGGGAAYYTTNQNSNGGAGGNTLGGNGLRAGVYSAAYCGSGGSQTAGGLAASSTTYPGATAGTLGIGGASAAGGANGSGGGGGGYYGGGAGISSGAGGGGSNYVTQTGTLNTIHTQGYQIGNGQLIISWYTPACVSTRTSVTVTVGTISTLPTSLSTSVNNVCAGTSVTLSETGGTIGGGANWNWYGVACGGTYLISGASVTQTPSVTTVYWIRAVGTCNTTTCLSITITVTTNTVPTSVNANPGSVCTGSSSTLSETGGNLVSGSSWNWFTASCGGTYLISGVSVIVSPTVLTTYWVRAQGSCNTSTCLSVTVSIATTTTPTNVTATPAHICAGAPSSLNATSAGNTITWWNSSTGGNYFGSSASAANFSVSPTLTTTYYAEAGSYIYNSQSFTFVTNSIVTWTVPSGLSSVIIDARGASGGYQTGYTAGRGARMVGTFAVTPGQVFSILVGQCPGVTANANTYPGGGGGSFVALGFNYATATPLVVAGGGGGVFTGTGVDASITTSGTGTNPGTNGNGAPAVQCGGGGGGFYTSGGNDTQYGYYGGIGFQQGGGETGAHSPGGNPVQYYQNGGAGGGAEADYWTNCNVRAGAGGGYSGGSGVDTTLAANIGQGGGSYNNGTNQTNTAGYNTGNGQVIISWIITGCASTRVPVTITVDSVSVIPTSLSANINCTSGSATLTENAGKLGTSANWNWYTVSCGGTYVISGATVIVNPTVNTEYWVRAAGSCNTTLCLSINVTISSTIPTSIAAAPATLCSGASTTLSQTGGVLLSGANWYWYTGSCGGTLIYTGAPSVQTPSVTTTYWVRGEGACTPTACLSVTVTVNQSAVAPVLATSSLTALCATNTSTIALSVSGGSGTDVRWYTTGCGTTSVGTGNPMTITHPAVTTVYWGRWESTGCTSSTCLSLTITIFTVPATPTSALTSGTNICSNAGGNITLSENGGIGEHIGWYTVSCGGTAIGTGNNLVISLPLTTTTYWVRWETATCSSSACKSVTTVIIPGPVDPTSVSSSDNNLCSNTGGTDTLISSGGSGSLVAWYTSSCGGTALSTGNPIIIQSPTISTTYYSRWESGSCGNSNCLSVTINVNPAPVAPLTIGLDTNNFCSGSIANINLNVSGGSGDTLKWFSSGCGITNIGVGSLLSLTAPNTTSNYYARWETSACGNSPCLTITVSVNPTPVIPLIASSDRNNLCSNDGGNINLSISGGSGTTLGWYTGGCGTTSLGNSNPLTLSAPTVTTTYYARWESSSCGNTGCVNIVISVITAPVAPSIATSDINNFCSDAGGNVTLSSSGGSGSIIEWYSGSCIGTMIGTGQIIVIPAPTITTTYYTNWQVTGCNNSTCANVQVTVIQTPADPNSSSANPSFINSGQSSTFTVNGNLPNGASWIWYQGVCGSGTIIGSGSSLTIFPTESEIYFVRGENGLCISNCSSVIVSVNGSLIGPGTVSATQNTICAGQSTTLNLTGTLNGGQWYWYSLSCGGIFEGTGSPLVVNPSVTTTYYVRQEQGITYSTCGNVLINVNLLSVSPSTISVSLNPVCSATPAILSISDGTLGDGASWNWYSGSCGGTFVGSGISVTISPTVTANYYIRAEGICNTTSCLSATLNVIYLPSQPGVITGNIFPTTGNNETYSVINVPGVTYTWTAPSGWIGSGTSNSITYTIGDTIGIVAVTPNNTCGAGPFSSLSIGGYRISGYFTYDNIANTPLDSVWVSLNQNGNILDSIQATINGYYEFNTLQNGTYEITATTHKPWSGVNSTDAVKVKRHFAGSEYFTSSLRLHTADVNWSDNINTTDAVKITRRFVGSDTTFIRGNWVFEKPLGGDTLNVSVDYNDTVIVNNNSVNQDFKGLCVGDVNGSNIPNTGAKSLSKLLLNSNDVKKLKSNEYFDLPIKVSEKINIGAVSLILNYPSELIDIIDVKLLTNSGSEDLNYKVNSNSLRIGWFESNDVFSLNNDNILLNIRIKTKNNFKNGDIVRFNLENNPLCEIADESGEPIENINLKTYSIEYSENINISSDNGELNNLILYPNPAKDNLQIKYYLANDGFVKLSLYNILGEKVMDIVNNSQLKGNYNSEVNISTIPSGIYTCKMILDDKIILNKRVIISK